MGLRDVVHDGELRVAFRANIQGLNLRIVLSIMCNTTGSIFLKVLLI